MPSNNDDPNTGPGTTSDPNQADRTGFPWKDKFKDVPEQSDGPKQTNPDPNAGPGTTNDPNQADRT
ncbi:hypothetical protein [Marivita sp. XM-24bin2]|jgi:hypothetical protein|uniref:hypothetical protein n=1 Tax=unclassified Marivita TaxID=2632480 RepID=UPI000D79BAC3|nr:hypothetical protein [Marivita sp. XM-24bin2]MCR9107774.1 hypothetical protein [Paracoccaceae bacterium]PWL35884.1 MAG: hypothetical protein DCO97_07255 [Marivita sp. XM-24bin2]